ncbi:hypothetical protein [Neomicrococcus lactis]|uniref:hypothetical protein n=1 Tax=Neomicrococcus lactis TaxID=732241 RepID=UPI00230011B7|nr:hypothetical protein [Neomicrococcus lactis]
MLAGFASGCSSNGPAEADEKSRRAVATLSEYPPEIEMAQQILIQDCIKKTTGLNPPLVTNTASGSPSKVIANVFSSEDEARRIGYPTTIADAPDAADVWLKGLSGSELDTYSKAMDGPADAPQFEVKTADGLPFSSSTVGCLADSKRELFGSLENEATFMILLNEYYSATRSNSSNRDADLSRLAPKFEKCMKDRGYNVSGFGVHKLAASSLGQYRKATDQPNAEEQKLAAVDFACQEEVNLRSTINNSLAVGAEDWLQANEGKLLAMQEELNKAKDRAIKIING